MTAVWRCPSACASRLATNLRFVDELDHAIGAHEHELREMGVGQP